jgi:uridine kinase
MLNKAKLITLAIFLEKVEEEKIMPSLKKMKRMSYKEAWEFFIKNLRMGSKEANDYFEYIAKFVPVCDIRGKYGIPEEIYRENTLILIDGASCCGKSTMASKIAERFPESVEVVDIDYLAKDWIEAELEKINDINEKFAFALQANALSDVYLTDNLEKIVSDKAKEGKTVILVGCFLEYIYRALIGTTLGKYFKKVVFFTVYESDEMMQKYDRARNNDTTKPALRVFNWKNDRYYNFLKQVMEVEPFCLGYGADLSFIIDGRTKLY